MTDTPHTEVLVVGAGPVGLTLALDLARRGIACRLLEQSPAYQIGTRGRGISLRTQQIFEDLGLLDALVPYDEGMAPARIYDRDTLISESNPASFFPPVPPPYHPILMISQEHTEAVLRARLASYDRQVELDTQLVSFTQNAQRVVAQVRHAGQDEQIQASFLVGCDGGHSTVRKAAGISFLGETWEEEHFLLGNTLIAGKETFADPSQLSITYRGGRLSCDLEDTTGIRAGDLAPDAVCVRAQSGEPVRLFELFRGTHFTLLVFGEQPVPPLPVVYHGSVHTYTIMPPESTVALAEQTLVDRDGQARRAYGIRGSALILVRPDGYIGLTGGSQGKAPLIDYLREVIGQ